MAGAGYDMVIAIGPLVMMKAVSELTRPPRHQNRRIDEPRHDRRHGHVRAAAGITVGGETKFACVDGPDFDGHLVDFDEAIRRSRTYKSEEAECLQRHECRLTGGAR